MSVERYAKRYLTDEVKNIAGSYRNNSLAQLTLYEKAVIYKYTNNGYEGINQALCDSKGTVVLPLAYYFKYCFRQTS
jgi:hypothetical protein